jgi:hypothetical protein
VVVKGAGRSDHRRRSSCSGDEARQRAGVNGRRITGPGQQLILHGISLDPQVDAGVRDLARVGPFDEISVGGNWTNSAVVRYLGGDFGPGYPKAGVPQVIVLEREIDQQITSLHVSAEHELARYIGTRDIWNWARQGAPLPK